MRAETRLYNRVDEQLRATHGCSVGQVQLLTIIERRTECRVLDIVAEIEITVGAVSKAIDRLEVAGWCRRTANPTDRRSSHLEITPPGRRVLAQARPTFEAEVARLVESAASARALETTGRTVAALRAALEKSPERG